MNSYDCIGTKVGMKAMRLFGEISTIMVMAIDIQVIQRNYI